MNELEERLAGVLRDAVPQPDVPEGMLRTAAARAMRIRRRRVAVRSAVGVVAVLGGSATAARLAGGSADHGLKPVASAPAPPAAQPPAAPSNAVRVLYEPTCSAAAQPGAHCTKVTIVLTDNDGTERQFALAERSTSIETVMPPPDRLTIHFSDGSEQVAEAREDGTGGWVFDITMPAGLTPDRVTLTYADGELRADVD